MNRLIATFTLFGLIGLFVMPFCEAQDQSEIPIGAILPSTGNTANFGFEAIRAIKVFESLQNRKGYKFNFIIEDGHCGIGPNASTAAHYLIGTKKVRAILGGCSGEVLQIAPIVEKAEVVLMGVVCGNPEIQKAGEYVYRTYPDLSQGASIIAKYLVSNNLSRVAILTETNSYTISIKNELTKFLEERVIVSEDISPEETNYRMVLLKAKINKPQAYYLNMSSPTAYQNILKQIKQMGIKEPLLSYYAPGERSSLENLGALQDGVIYFDIPDVDNTTKEYQEFLQSYKAMFSEDPIAPFLLMTSYNGIRAVTDMIINTENDSTKFQDYLNKSGVHGAAGKMSFDKNGDLMGSEFILRKIEDGKPKKISTK